LGFYLYANYVLMGDPFKSPLAALGVGGDAVSFFNDKHPLRLALLSYYAMMSMFISVVFGWPPIFTTGLFLAFLLLAKKDVWALYLFLIFVSMSLVNTLTPRMISVAHMYGPRYVYESFFVFVLLAAVGWDCARRLAQRGVELFVSSRFRCAKALSWSVHIAFLALLAVLVFGTQQRWLSRTAGLFNFRFMPANVFGLKGMNHTSGAMLEKIRDQGIHHALIFVEDPDSSWCWWYYGAVFTLNSPFLDSDIIAVRDLGPQENKKVIDAFPGRGLFRVNVQHNEIRNYE